MGIHLKSIGRLMKVSKKMAITALVSSLMMTGCASTTTTDNSALYNGMARNAMLGAATGAVTQINGDSEDIQDAATVGALLGLLGSLY